MVKLPVLRNIRVLTFLGVDGTTKIVRLSLSVLYIYYRYISLLTSRDQIVRLPILRNVRFITFLRVRESRIGLSRVMSNIIYLT